MGIIHSLRMPEMIFYGRGSFHKVGEEAAIRGKKALIISDQIMHELGKVNDCVQHLKTHNVESTVYLGIRTEPIDTYVEEGLKQYQEENCDLIISLGGGSCLDAAKAIAVVQESGGSIAEYLGGKKLATASVPHIAIPTTAGTGSEVTDVTVITNTATGVKMMIKQPAFIPTVAIVDSALTISSPKYVTAAAGIDALSHAIEAYLSKKAHPLTDILALSAMELIVKNIRRAFFYGDDDLEARDAMSLGAMQAGIAFSNASVCLVHGMSRPIGALFHVPHGLSNAMLLPPVLEYSQEECKERLAKLGGFFLTEKKSLPIAEAAQLAVEEVKKLCLDLEIPNLQSWGVDQKSYQEALDKMATDALASGSPGNNPRVPTKEEIKDLYLLSYNYQFSGS